MSHSFISRLPIILAMFALAATGPVQADKSKGNGASKKSAEPQVSATAQGEASLAIGTSASLTVSAGISFGEARQIAVDYGLTGHKPLPPGIRKNLARGKPLPPGIARTRMPNSFVDHLPHHEGHEWQQAGADLVLVAIGSLIIADILHHVFD